MVVIKGVEFTRKDLEAIINSIPDPSLTNLAKVVGERVQAQNGNGEVKVARFSITSALRHSGLYRKWKKGRNGVRVEVSTRAEERLKFVGALLDPHRALLNTIDERLGDLSRTDRALKLALKDFRRYPKGTDLKQRYRLFQGYLHAKDNEISASYSDLARFTGIKWDSSVCKILSRNGLPSLRWKFHKFTEEDKQILEGLLETKFSYQDIAYFMGFKDTIIRRRSKGKRTEQSKHYIKKFGFSGDILTFRCASDIYYCSDIGFDRKETSELLGFPLRVVRYAIAHRSEIEWKIVNALQRAWPEEDHTKLYRLETSQLA